MATAMDVLCRAGVSCKVLRHGICLVSYSSPQVQRIFNNSHQWMTAPQRAELP